MKKIEITLQILHKTQNAFLVTDGTREEEVIWLPRSVVDWDSPDGVGDVTTFYIPEWLALKKELI